MGQVINSCFTNKCFIVLIKSTVNKILQFTIKLLFQFTKRRFYQEDPLDLNDPKDKKFVERYRVPRIVVDLLEERFYPELKSSTNRNQPLTPRQQILVFLHFLGTNSVYHDIRDCHGISTDTVFRCVHKVAELVFFLRHEVLRWPENVQNVAQQFFEIGGMPSVCGCVDGTHVLVKPPQEEENSFVNRHHSHSINAVMCCGPDLKIYYANAKAPGSWHDSHVSFYLNNILTLINTRA